MIISQKFGNITEGTILEHVYANDVTYEAASRPYTDENGDTVVDAVSYQTNEIYALYPQDYRVRTR